jgi:hypothetical protein
VKRFVKDCASGFWPSELSIAFAKVANVGRRNAFAERRLEIDLDLCCVWYEAGG